MHPLRNMPPVPFRAVLALIVVLAASLTGNIMLLPRRTLASTHSMRPLIGLAAPPLAATSVRTGARETVKYSSSDQPTVLYVFMPTCSWCARNRANIESLVRQTRGRFRFVALSLNEKEVEPSLSRLGIAFPSYFGASDLVVETLRLNSTPQLVVISPQGTVVANWVGAWSGAGQREIESFFHIRLPGLREPGGKG